MKKVLLLVGALSCFAVALYLTDGGTKTGKQVWTSPEPTTEEQIQKLDSQATITLDQFLQSRGWVTAYAIAKMKSGDTMRFVKSYTEYIATCKQKSNKLKSK